MFLWMKIKALSIAFKPIMLQMYSDVCVYVTIAWALGSKGLPLFKQFKVYGTWQLSSPNSVQQRKQKDKENCSEVVFFNKQDKYNKS